MPTAHRVVRNAYHDSIGLMRLSSVLAERPGVEQVSLVMATAANLDLLRETGLFAEAVDARANDVLIVVRAKSRKLLEEALEEAERTLTTSTPVANRGEGVPQPNAPRSTQMAIDRAAGANLALISVPGEYAAAEAMKALRLGLNVMLFSNGVTLEDEVALKHIADAGGLILMGPDCGTAILHGVPLGFANVVRRGAIGCVGASGTGLQQVTSLVDRLGQGISHAIGTGGRDLSAAVGGTTMIAGLRMLSADRDTKVIVLISKPPVPEVARKVLDVARKAAKPVVVCFIGAEAIDERKGKVYFARTLEDAAQIAVALVSGRSPTVPRTTRSRVPSIRSYGGQRYVRGLYSGGTFAYEALWLLADALGEVWSNVALRPELELASPWVSVGHTIVDLGDDTFTRGRPHPMIDCRLRNERISQEARDPEVAVILLDVVLGHSAHPDPAAELVAAIRAAQATAAKNNRCIAFVGFLCGTARDPQGFERQEAALRNAGMTLAQSNASAVRIAAAIAKRLTSKTAGQRKRRKA